MASDGIRVVLERATPRPWATTVEAFAGMGLSVLREPRSGEPIGNISAAADAELIVAAVNEHEPLLLLAEQARKAHEAWMGGHDLDADMLAIEKHLDRLDRQRERA